VFVPPENRDVPIWRYMDFSKYVSLLDRQALFFARADLLGDPFEGSVGALNLALRQESFARSPDAPKDAFDKFAATISKFFENQRRWTFVNCWHMNDHESAAMWRLYAQSNEAIAIQSTYALLDECLPAIAVGESPIFVGQVQYVDYATEAVPDGNAYYPFVHKRKSYAHEHEVRAVFQDFRPPDQQFGGPGLNVPVDLPKLVRCVRVAPSAPPWFRELVASVTRRYHFQFGVEQSTLDAAPLF
jgi:hypothetical protein